MQLKWSNQRIIHHCAGGLATCEIPVCKSKIVKR